MQFLALADTHLGYFSGRSAEARRQMAIHAYHQFVYCIQQAINHNVDFIIHSGDIFNRSQPPKWIIEHYYQAIQQALNQGIGLFVIPGNHDRAKLDSSLLEFMYPNYEVFHSLRARMYEGVQIIGLPFVYEKHQQVLNKIEKMINQTDYPSLVITHQLFDGATFGPHQHVFSNQPRVFNISALPDRAQFITGHVHRAQSLQQGKVVYTGSTIRTSFAEMIEPKGYILGRYEGDLLDLKFVPIPSMDMAVIELDGRNLDVEYLDDQLGKVSRETRLLVRMLYSRFDGSQIRQLYQRYDKKQWPYLRISPRSPDIKLQALYRGYTSFQFEPISRTW